MKSILIWSGAGLLIVGGLLALFTFVDPQAPAFAPEGSRELLHPVEVADHAKGSLNSAVVLVEYGDFQCPACKSYVPIIAELEKEFGNRVKFVYRHYPLPSHSNSQNAARAAEAAALQGKFWEMHDVLFDKQNEWSSKGNPEDAFVIYAESIGLDTDQFRGDYDSGELKAKIREALAAANANGLNSTPTFFLNGVKLANPRTYDAFKKVIVAALGESGEQPSDETQPSESGEPEEQAEDSRSDAAQSDT